MSQLIILFQIDFLLQFQFEIKRGDFLFLILIFDFQLSLQFIQDFLCLFDFHILQDQILF